MISSSDTWISRVSFRDSVVDADDDIVVKETGEGSLDMSKASSDTWT